MLTLTVTKCNTYNSTHFLVCATSIGGSLALHPSPPFSTPHPPLLCIVSSHSAPWPTTACQPTLTMAPTPLSLSPLGSYLYLDCRFLPSSLCYLLCDSSKVSPLPRSLSRGPPPSGLGRALSPLLTWVCLSLAS